MDRLHLQRFLSYICIQKNVSFFFVLNFVVSFVIIDNYSSTNNIIYIYIYMVRQMVYQLGIPFKYIKNKPAASTNWDSCRKQL